MLFRLLYMLYWDKHAVISTALTQIDMKFTNIDCGIIVPRDKF
jgi:hypothetical protein